MISRDVLKPVLTKLWDPKMQQLGDSLGFAVPPLVTRSPAAWMGANTMSLSPQLDSGQELTRRKSVFFGHQVNDPKFADPK